MTPDLFTPLQLGAVHTSNRIYLAPLTRCRAESGNVPCDLNAEYYRQRGYGYPNTPGIFNDAHVAGWKKVTNAVHEAGGLIFLQLWHVGRVSHPIFQPSGGTPIAPSAVKPKGQVFTGTEMADYVTPRALEREEIPGIIAEYAHGAAAAKAAGFDGVEIHNANGYLLDQF